MDIEISVQLKKTFIGGKVLVDGEILDPAFVENVEHYFAGIEDNGMMDLVIIVVRPKYFKIVARLGKDPSMDYSVLCIGGWVEVDHLSEYLMDYVDRIIALDHHVIEAIYKSIEWHYRASIDLKKDPLIDAFTTGLRGLQD